MDFELGAIADTGMASMAVPRPSLRLLRFDHIVTKSDNNRKITATTSTIDDDDNGDEDEDDYTTNDSLR